jgi:hypothetical protein
MSNSFPYNDLQITFNPKHKTQGQNVHTKCSSFYDFIMINEMKNRRFQSEFSRIYTFKHINSVPFHTRSIFRYFKS